MSEHFIPVASVSDPEWNSRLYNESEAEKKEIEDLASSMKRDGQLQSIGVEDAADGTFLLVFGSRRLRAAKLLQWDTIRADVNPATDAATRVVRNVLENVKRKDLSSYEQARACTKLREIGMSGPDIGARLGFSKQKVSNLAVSYNSLAPTLLERWRAGDETATVDFLRELAGIKGKTDEERFKLQTEAWNARDALRQQASEMLDPSDDEGDDAPAKKKKADKDKPDAPFKVPAQRYFDLVRAIQKAKLTGGVLAIQALKYAVGEIDAIKGLIEPEAPAEPAKKSKAA